MVGPSETVYQTIKFLDRAEKTAMNTVYNIIENIIDNTTEMELSKLMFNIQK